MIHYHIGFKEDDGTDGIDSRTFVHEDAAKAVALGEYEKTEGAETFPCSDRDCGELIQGSVA